MKRVAHDFRRERCGRREDALGPGPDMSLRGATEEVGLALTPPPRYRSLLVPVDNSPFGEHTLPIALGIARRAGAKVRVMHAHSPWNQPSSRTGFMPTAARTAGIARAAQGTSRQVPAAHVSLAAPVRHHDDQGAT
jgi:Universal stress protein family